VKNGISNPVPIYYQPYKSARKKYRISYTMDTYAEVIKKLDRNFQMHMVDEYKTSLICNACHQECQPVRHFTLNKTHTDIDSFATRDLNQCATTGCLISHDRDLNAAKNILSSRVKNNQSHSREIRRKKS
jgi:putative NADPH-quinone reductase